MKSSILVSSVVAVSAGSGLGVDWAKDGKSYEITVDGVAWFASGPMFTTVDGKRFAAEDGSLVHQGVEDVTKDRDELGSFSRTTHRWIAGSTRFETSVRIYDSDDIAIFTHSWPQGANGTAATSVAAFREAEALGAAGAPQVSSCFPSLNTADASSLGFVTFAGRFLEGSREGAFRTEMPGQGQDGGPFVVFSNETSTPEGRPNALVFSAATNIMEASWGQEGQKDFCGGLMATVTEVPKGYSMETMVYLGRGDTGGINGAVRGYGQTMMKKHGTKRLTDADTTLKYLGYSTDNGAYYYYKPVPGKSYEETLLDVHDYAAQEQIPYKTLLLDSWWYTQGKGGGVKEWEPTDQAFPHGFDAFRKSTGWDMQMHSRMWSNDNVYAKENGGDYDFVLEDPLSIPTEQRFWDDLMANKTEQGLVLYEQDWMYNEWQGLNATLQSPTLGDQWLTQMSVGAEKSNVGVQYCMTFARMVVHSVQANAVTQFRAGDDYHPGQTGYFPTSKDPSGETGCRFPYCVYYIGTTSILAWGLDLAPAKDDFWTTAVQPNSPYGNETSEPYNEMEAAISAYSTGPVQPSDGLGFSNVSLISMTCTSEGRLLQPSAPARTIDAAFVEAALGDGSGSLGPLPLTPHNHAVMATHTDVMDARWLHVLSIGLAKDFDLKPSHVLGELASWPSTPYVAWSGYGSRNVTLLGRFEEKSPMRLRACGYADFGLVHAAPVFKGDCDSCAVALLGEVSKFVPVAVARVVGFSRPSKENTLTVQLEGAPGEQVELAFAMGDLNEIDRMKVVYASTTLGQKGTGAISAPSGGGVVMV